MNKRQRKKIWQGRGSGKYYSLYEYPGNTSTFCRKLMKEFGNEKQKWALTLKVGDFVEDCNYRKVQIRDIKYTPYHVMITTTMGRSCDIVFCCDEVTEFSLPDIEIKNE